MTATVEFALLIDEMLEKENLCNFQTVFFWFFIACDRGLMLWDQLLFDRSNSVWFWLCI